MTVVKMVTTRSWSPSSTTLAVAALVHLASFMTEPHFVHSPMISFAGVTLALQVRQDVYSSTETMTSISPSMVVKVELLSLSSLYSSCTYPLDDVHQAQLTWT